MNRLISASEIAQNAGYPYKKMLDMLQAPEYGAPQPAVERRGLTGRVYRQWNSAEIDHWLCNMNVSSGIVPESDSVRRENEADRWLRSLLLFTQRKFTPRPQRKPC